MSAAIAFSRPRLPVLLLALVAAGAGAEPLDWRFQPGLDAPAEAAPPPPAEPPEPKYSPSPVVLPSPEPIEREECLGGWHWIQPRLAGNPGESWSEERTAVQLANQQRDAELARKHQSPVDQLLPESLQGFGPLGVESGIEWRF